jgi:hypothetical protein
MDLTNTGNQDGSLAIPSTSETRGQVAPVRPKLYLLRHAEVCYSFPAPPYITDVLT